MHKRDLNQLKKNNEMLNQQLMTSQNLLTQRKATFDDMKEKKEEIIKNNSLLSKQVDASHFAKMNAKKETDEINDKLKSIEELLHKTETRNEQIVASNIKIKEERIAIEENNKIYQQNIDTLLNKINDLDYHI